ncbi:hypothetical protein [Undibacterium griseum]|uniref:Uncharacterized protein n=1 Tax=Undibacterium griseum TaxID=2762295 RepID=A0ABR6YKD0_9BURK|nr:hypothetical protein [Undibacterium griseum]MBC3884263.1 hypothetical protein [Undibacterium griseum]
MSPIAAYLSGQRLILVTGAAWSCWCVLIMLAAPYQPGDFLLVLFILSLLLTYAGSVWMVYPLLSAGMWVGWRLLILAATACVPFTMIVVIGHFIGLAVRTWLS